MLNNNFQSLSDVRYLVGKCPRCSLCKFPPLVTVETKAHSSICPSYEEFKVHASSGSGLMVLGASLVDGRASVTETIRNIAYGCTACGGCDTACKFNSDIEILESIYLLRAKVFESMGPLPAHARILQSLRTNGHPLPEFSTDKGAWTRDVDLKGANGTSRYLLWIGSHYALDPQHRETLAHAIALLNAAAVTYTILGADEPDTGRAALEIGDRSLFADFARKSSDAIMRHKAPEVLCLSAADYATLRAVTPRFAHVTKPIRHIVELYADLVGRGRLKPRRSQKGRVAWHDASYLGRLSEPWIPWQGEQKKVLGQMIIMEPRRPVRRGAGCYDEPRAVLNAIPGVQTVEFHRRRENAFDSGEGGQATAVAPDFTRNTARLRLAEAVAVGADTVVTECPQSVAILRASRTPDSPNVASLTNLLATSVL